MAQAIHIPAEPKQSAAPDKLGPLPSERPSQILIEDLAPVIGDGRYRVKRCVGDSVAVSAAIFRSGHDLLGAAVRYRLAEPGGRWREAPLAPRGEDSWTGAFTVSKIGYWSWQVIAWTARFATWRSELARKLAAGQDDLSSELAEGAELLRQLAERAIGADREAVVAALALLEGEADSQVRQDAALAPVLVELAARYPDRHDQAQSGTFEIDVDRSRARFGSWFELFPRSWGGFEGVRSQLGELAELGFDVIYLPPIHPIGLTARRGPNDSSDAGPTDPGSPWAIGAAAGGHMAIHPDLGTVAEFERLVADAAELGIDIALDFAANCSADHPWLHEHPEWFFRRPDGSLKYAENPPKRYLDIYNLDFECEDWRGLWEALREVMLYWVERGVRAFRVDNPHTKPVAFWEWMIESVRAQAPETIFLSEAFTREPMMNALAKSGFSQSYTYFTWKNTAWELRDYLEHLASDPIRDFLRPNFFVNTPDILTEYLQHGGPPAFAVRLLLATTLSPSWGMYSGFERFEATPRDAGSEEYLDSEKYQLRERKLDGPLLPAVARLNRIRREHPALQRLENIVFLPVENDSLLAYAKQDANETLIAVVNLDPHHAQEGVVIVPEDLGLAPAFRAEDLCDGGSYRWRLGRNYVRLDPAERPGHLLAVDES
jgi:starch synthase (maltosyl-transferring)